MFTKRVLHNDEQPSGISSFSRELEPETATVCSGEPVPLLFVEVNITPDQAERISVFEGDSAAALALAFVRKHGLSDHKRTKLEALLRIQMNDLKAETASFHSLNDFVR